ncbi:MAG: adenylyltransferase/cytidyltransferase family protein [Bacteroidales bacterium]|nr:adenylyltransferase/cytidyltransferase family protein [Bacteroidales bacterium]
MKSKVFVSGCYDLLHSGHVEFFRQAAQYGDLYVGIGSDETILHYKGHHTLYDENERLFMVKAIRYVKDAYINKGSGIMDFIPTVDFLKPDILVVNEDGDKEEKRQFCKERGIEYVVLERTPHVVPHAALDAAQSLIPASEPESQEIAGQARNEGGQARNEGTALPTRSSTNIKDQLCQIPTRLDLAGTWIDQPYVSQYAPGWAITISLEPTFEIRERCGLSTSTRNMIKKIWPVKLPNMDPEFLAKLMFCFENDPERDDGIISGAQDAIGICMPGLVRHYYDKRYWPLKFESCHDEDILQWLENHLVMIPMEPRKPGCSVVEGKDITETKVKALAKAADDCWKAIMHKDLDAFAKAYKASFEAQVAMFPGMIHPIVMQEIPQIPHQVRDEGRTPHRGPDSRPHSGLDPESPTVQDYINKWSSVPGVLAWKMPGAGGGGYLACVVEDAEAFCKDNNEALKLTIRR